MRICIKSYVLRVLQKQVLAQEPANVTSGVAAIFQEKCKKHSTNPEAFNELIKEAGHFSQCFRDELSLLITGAANKNCVSMRKEVVECAKRVLRKAQFCLSPEESYLYNFGVRAMEKALDYLCEGTHFQTIFNEEGMNCLRGKDTTTVDNCYKFKETTSKTKIGNEVILTKDALCTDLRLFSKCMESYIELNCNLPNLKTNFYHMMYNMRSPCRTVTHTIKAKASDSASVYVNNFILVAFSYLVYNWR